MELPQKDQYLKFSFGMDSGPVYRGKSIQEDFIGKVCSVTVNTESVYIDVRECIKDTNGVSVTGTMRTVYISGKPLKPFPSLEDYILYPTRWSRI